MINATIDTLPRPVPGPVVLERGDRIDALEIEVPLGRDRLGRTYRARCEETHGTVLMRTFEDPSLVSALTPLVLETIEVRRPGERVGLARGLAYLVSPYDGGQSLADLQRVGSLCGLPLPTDLALLVSVRVAEMMAARAEASGRPHQFLVPELVQISTGGSVQIHGDLVGPVLRKAAVDGGALMRSRSYIAPGVLAGREPTIADDVHSAGIQLLEMMTGHSSGFGPAADLGRVLHGARLTSEDRPLPFGAIEVLRCALTPGNPRIKDWSEWQNGLQRMILEGWHKPTTGALATLVRDFTTEKEAELAGLSESRDRSTLDVQDSTSADSPAEATSALFDPPPAATAEAADEPSDGPASVHGSTADRPARHHRPWLRWIGIGVLLSVVALALTFS